MKHLVTKPNLHGACPGLLLNGEGVHSTTRACSGHNQPRVGPHRACITHTPPCEACAVLALARLSPVRHARKMQNVPQREGQGQGQG